MFNEYTFIISLVDFKVLYTVLHYTRSYLITTILYFIQFCFLCFYLSSCIKLNLIFEVSKQLLVFYGKGSDLNESHWFSVFGTVKCTSIYIYILYMYIFLYISCCCFKDSETAS